MLFHTWQFFVFFAIIFVVYWRLNRRQQNHLLLAASYFFYGWWDWRFLSLIIGSTAIDFLAGRAIANSSIPTARRRWLGVSLLTNLGLLGLFKYFDFFTASLAQLLDSVGLTASLPTLNVILPVGISFYTFQTLSYTIDIYRRRLQPTLSPSSFALFVAFFPQLIAGPIERARNLLPQIEQPRHLNRELINQGLWLFWWGLWLKIFVADGLAPLVNSIYDLNGQVNGSRSLIGAWAFSWQIFADFAGYSSMARGLANLLGFNLMINFNLPFWSQNVRELWQRWHISLSSWVRDYIYIPLGGNRCGTARTALNIWLTMTVMGLWHGASGHFVWWGMYFGVAAIIYRLYQSSRWARGWGKIRGISPRLVWHINVFITFNVFAISMILFRSQSMSQVVIMLASLTNLTLPWPAESLNQLVQLTGRILPVILASIYMYRRQDILAIAKLSNLTKAPLIGLMLYGLLFYGGSGEAFLYFAF